MKTNKGLVEYCKAQLGKPYWMGTFGQIATQGLYNYNKNRLARYYRPWNNFPCQFGQRVHDCIGLVKGFMWSDTPESPPKYCSNGCPDVNEAGMYANSTEKGGINTMPDIPGILVYMPGHVGVYIGGGEVIEARGHEYGVVKTKLQGRGWTKWSKCPYIQYEEQVNHADRPQGNDVSFWQGELDWTKYKGDFAIIRIGRGAYGTHATTVDKQFERNASECNRLGIPLGGYFFIYASTVEEAHKEAAFCLELIKKYKFTYPIVADYEYDSEKKASTPLSKALKTKIVRTFLEDIEKGGYYAMIYANLDFLNNHFEKGLEKRFDLWLAEWDETPDCSDTPSLPCGIHQYGIDLNAELGLMLDSNVAYKDYPALISKLGLNHLEDTPEPKEPQKPTENVDFVEACNIIKQNGGQEVVIGLAEILK